MIEGSSNMIISIRSILKDHMIHCSSDYGNFTAEWCSESPPIVGNQYDVEINVVDSPKLHIVRTGNAEPKINDTKKGVEFCVQIGSIEEDPVLCFQIGDSLFLFALDEYEKTNVYLYKKGQWITFVSGHVQLYNTEILGGCF